MSGIGGGIAFLRRDEETIAQDGAGGDFALGVGDEEFGGMDEDDPLAIFAGAGLEEAIVFGGTEHTSGGAEEEIGTVTTETGDELRFATVGADHDADAAMGGRKTGSGCAGFVTGQFMLEAVLAVLAEEFSSGSDEDGDVVAEVAIGFGHSGDEVNIEFVGQSGEFAVILPGGDRFSQGAVDIEGDGFIGDGVTVEETFGGTDQLRAVRGGLTNERFGALIIGGFIALDPFENDSGDLDGGGGLICRDRLLLRED